MRKILHAKIIDKSHYGVALCLMIMAIAFCAYYFYYQQAASLPFYASWDMELVTAVDMLLIKAQLLPSHFAHTAFGMYLLMSGAVKVGASLHALSISNLNELHASLNPLLSMAEFTRFLRLLSPAVFVLSLLCIWASLHTRLKPQPLISVLVFLCLVNQASFWGISYIIRTELYAWFFWTLALLLGTFALKQQRGQRILWVLTGLSMGLAFTTKLQAIFYLACLPLVLLSLASITDHHAPNTITSIKSTSCHRYTRFIAIFNIALIAILGLFAMYAPTYHVKTVRDAYSLLTPQYIGLISMSGVALAGFYFTDFLPNYAKALPQYLSYLILGFLLSYFLSPLLYGNNVSLSLTHSILMFKISVLGKVPQHFQQLLGLGSFTNLYHNLLQYKVLYSELISLIVLTVILQAQHILRKNPWLWLSALLILGIQCAFLYFAIRFGGQRDQFWNESLPSLIVLILWLNLAIAAMRHRAFFKWLSLLGLIQVALLHSYAWLQPQAMLGYYSEPAFTQGPYGANQQLYTQVMQQYFHASRAKRAELPLVFKQATQVHAIKNLLHTLFLWHPLHVSQCGIAAPHLPLQYAKLDSLPAEHFQFSFTHMAFVEHPTPSMVKTQPEIIQQLPSFLQGDLLINPFAGINPLTPTQAVLNLSSALDRYDVKLYLFMPKPLVPSAWRGASSPSLQLITKRGDKPQYYQGFLLNNARVATLLKQPQPFFLIVKPDRLSVGLYPQKTIALPYGRTIRIVQNQS